MVSAAGGALRGVGTLLYILDFLCAAGIVGIYSYFIAALVKGNTGVANTWRAVEGLSGAAVLYTIFAILLTCFLGGMRVFAFLGIVMDLLFMGAMIAIAVLVRQGVRSCSGTVNTPFGTGLASAIAPYQWNPSYGTVCKLQKAVFSLAVAGAGLFLLTALVQFMISAHHQKEKKYGPGPNNGYTSGSGKRTWWTKKKVTTEDRFPKDAEAGMVAAPVVAYESIPRTNVVRPSHDTTHTETTAVGANDYGNGTLNKIEQRTDRTILPPVVDRPVSRAASRTAPVEVATSGVTGATAAHSHNNYYSGPAENGGYVVENPEQSTAGYYSGPTNEGGFYSGPAAVEVTKAIYGHENTNSGRKF